MTPKEALETLKNKTNISFRKSLPSVEQALDVIQKLVERDTSMKPIKNEYDEYDCPVCGVCVLEHHVHKDKNFCNNCGQRLDWS